VVVHIAEDANDLFATRKSLVVKREPVLPVNSSLPNVLEALDLFDVQGGMAGIFSKQDKDFESLFLDTGRQSPEGALESLAAAEDHSSDSRF